MDLTPTTPRVCTPAAPGTYAVQWAFVISSTPDDGVITTYYSIADGTMVPIETYAQAKRELASTLHAQPGIRGAIVARFGTHDTWHSRGLSITELHESWRR